MQGIQSAFLSLIVFGIISGQIISAQRRQGIRLSNLSSRRGQAQRIALSRPIPRSFLRNGRSQVLPGPRHVQPDTVRALQQRLSTTGRGSARRRVPTRSNRIRSAVVPQRVGRQRTSHLAALHRQPAPARTSLKDQPASRTRSSKFPARPEQLKIFARNLKVIDGWRRTPSHRQNTQAGRSSRRPVSQQTKKSPKKSNKKTQKDNATSRVRNAGSRSLSRPNVRSPLRIRARLRQMSSQGSHTVQNKDQPPSNINNRNGEGGKPQSQQQSRQKDMVAVDDIISLVNAIKESKEPSHTNSRANVSSNSGTSITKKSETVPPKPTQISPLPITTGVTNEVQTSPGNNYIDLMQFALMNSGDGGFVNGLFSNPLFLAEMSSGGTGTLALPTKSQMSSKKEQTSVIIHPSLLPNRGRSAKIPKSGNSVQDKMLASLMAQTMKNIREDMQESIRKRLSDGDVLAPGSADNVIL